MSGKFLNENIPERILKKLYRKSPDELRSSLHLKNAQETQFISEWRECKQGMIFASDDIKSLDKAIVCGGPCIDHCNADIGKLRINVLVDMIWPIVVASRLKLPCCLILYIPNEMDVMYKNYDNINKWGAIGDKLEKIAQSLANSLKVEEFQICRTDNEKVLDGFNKWNGILNVNCENLKDIYTLGLSNKNIDKKVKNIEPWIMLIYKRNMMLYFPQFISEYIGKEYDSIITVENIHQGMAINRAKKIVKKIDDKKNLYHIAYVTPPSLTYKTRMSRSKNAMIFIENNKEEMINLFSGGLQAAKIYWNNCLPSEIYSVLNFKSTIEFFSKISNDICEDIIDNDLAKVN